MWNKALKIGSRFFSTRNPMIAATAGYAALQGGASFVDSYAQNMSSSSQAGAGMVSGAMRLGSYYVGFRGLANTAHFGGRILGGEASKATRSLGRTGRVGSMIRSANPLSLALKAPGLAAKGLLGTATLGPKALYGAGEYAFNFARAGKSLLKGGVRSSWGTFTLGAANMKHPFAPFAVAGLAGGGLSALSRNYQYGENGWQRTIYDDPQLPGYLSTGATGPVNTSNFGSGVSFGRSAVRSSYVMRGQEAITQKMVTNRRV